MAEPAKNNDSSDLSGSSSRRRDSQQPSAYPRPRKLEGGGEGDGVPQGELNSVRNVSGNTETAFTDIYTREREGGDIEQPSAYPRPHKLEGGGEGDGVPQGELNSVKDDKDDSKEGNSANEAAPVNEPSSANKPTFIKLPTNSRNRRNRNGLSLIHGDRSHETGQPEAPAPNRTSHPDSSSAPQPEPASSDNEPPEEQPDQARQDHNPAPDTKNPALEALAESEGHPATNDHDSKSEKAESPEGLSEAEHADNKRDPESFFNSTEQVTTTGGFKNFFWGTARRKRASVGAGVTGLLLSGVFFGIAILSGPAEIIQLSHVLQGSFGSANRISLIRGNQLLRYSARDVGETRLGLIGRQILRPTVASLKDIGIEFNTNSIGNLNSVDIDTDTLAETYPDLDGLSGSARQDWLAQKFKLDPSQISPTQGRLSDATTKFTIDATDFPLTSVTALVNNTLGFLSDGLITTAIKTRILSDYFGDPSIFHPESRLSDAALKKLANIADAKAYEQNSEQEAASSVEGQADSALTDYEGDKSFLDSGVAKAVLVTGGACLTYTTAKDIVAIDQDRVVFPAAVEAVRIIALGAQAQAGQDITAQQIGAAVSNLTNASGQSVWQGKALQVTEGEASPSGTDLPGEYQQAFSSDTTEENIEAGANDFFEKLTGGLDGAGGKFGACSPLGIAAQALVVVGVGAFGALADAFSGGALTPLEIAAIGATFAGKQAINVGISAVATTFVEKFVLNKTTIAKLALDAFSGPIGGDFLAYGAREADNISAMSSGGIALSNSNSTTIADAEQQQTDQQFRSQSFFARMFDINDYQSLAGRLADTITPSFSHNLTSAVASLGHIGSILSSIFSDILPHANAAPTPYDWGFPTYGIPDSILEDSSNPTTEDPYLNSCYLFSCPDYTDPQTGQPDPIVGVISDASGNLTSDGQTYINNAETCFGININDNAGLWEVTPAQAPANPDSDDYANADCDNTGDLTWERMILFVADSRTAEAMACYTGDTTSCQEVGYDN